MEKLTLPTGYPHQTIEIQGKCQGVEALAAVATCVPLMGANGRWDIDYIPCETGSLEQLTNLLDVSAQIFILSCVLEKQK